MSKLKYFKNLDGLRALAALAVMVAHFFGTERIPNSPTLVKLTQMGNSGVSLFFVLSGFVITRILLNTVKGEKYFMNFYGRRTLRIFPLYYFSLLCYNYVPYLLGIKPLGDFHKQWYHYVYLQNFARTFGWDSDGPGHFWSLAVEEHFYLIWPTLVLLAYTVNKNRLLLISFFIMLFSLVLRFLMLNNGYEIDVFTFTRIDQLALGCILAIMEYKGILEKMNNKLFLLAIVFGVGFVGVSSTFGYFYLNLFKHNAYGLLYFGIIGYCLTTDSSKFFNVFLTSSPMQYLGKISYGLYIWHILAILLLEHYMKTINLTVDFSIMVVLTIIFSTASYYLLELKFLTLKKYFK